MNTQLAEESSPRSYSVSTAIHLREILAIILLGLVKCDTIGLWLVPQAIYM